MSPRDFRNKPARAGANDRSNVLRSEDFGKVHFGSRYDVLRHARFPGSRLQNRHVAMISFRAARRSSALLSDRQTREAFATPERFTERVLFCLETTCREQMVI
jgi:hypothetical protein